MKKLLLVLPVLATLILTWCGSSSAPVVEETVNDIKEPVKEIVAEVKEEVKKEVAEQKVEVKKEIEKKAEGHQDTSEIFASASFWTSKEVSIDGYDIEIKHKDDIHAWEKLTWTITVTEWWNAVDGFEKIDGDLWVWIVRDPVDHDEHIHPLANTKNTLTFSAHTHDAGEYKVITQFQHNGKKVTIPYTLTLLANTWDHHD